MLTVDEMTAIWKDVIFGQPCSVKGDEAERMYRGIKREKKEADEKGLVLEMPFEW